MAHVTDLGFTMSELGKAIDEGRVRKQSHPTKPLDILNYTEEVQFSKRWDNITLQTRGLIIHAATGEIVARPWKKFFNLGERDNEIDFDGPVEVTDKMDGSLGILYHDGDDLAIATRGSFASEQAIHGTGLLRDVTKWMDLYEPAYKDYTFLFEIIYPENRIVVNYGMADELVLLGGVHQERGWYIGPLEAKSMLDWPGRTTQVFDYPTFGHAISAPDREGKEGIVIRSGSKMVKLKQADYVELHRIVTNLSPKTIWAQMGEGKTVGDICAQIPDEFHSYVEDIGRDLWRQASEITFEANNQFLECISDMGCTYGEATLSRKRFAELAAKKSHKKYLFMLLDKRPIDGVVWQSIKPRGDAPLVKEL